MAKTEKSKKKKKPQSEAGEVTERIEWNEEASGLDFVSTETDPENPVQRFEMLAKRVAETAAQNLSALAAGAASAFDEPSELENQPSDQSDQFDQSAQGNAPDAQQAEAARAVATESGETPATEEVDGIARHVEAAEAEVRVEAEAQDVSDDLAVQAAADEAMAGAEFIDNDRLVSICESLLFSTDKPVSIATIKQVVKGSNIKSKDIAAALESLASEYASARRGVSLEEVNGGFQLRTKSDNGEYLRRLAKVRPFRLSGPALEVMAIIAYKQPITKHQIDEIRGVESGHLIRALMERGLVAFGEKSDLPGKPMTYQSTRKFLETFGLRNIRELPSLGEIDELLPEGIGEPEEEKEKLSDLTDAMSQELATSYSEGEEELVKINEQLKSVDTTSEFFEQEKQRERERRDRERAKDIRERMVLGDAVDEKDRRWLDRYEAKLHAPPPGSEAPTSTAEETRIQTSGSGDEAFPQELSRLTEESIAKAAEPLDDGVEAEDDSLLETGEESEDLIARPDWNDDKEFEA